MLKQYVIAICGPHGSADPLIHFFDHTPLNNASYIILRHLPANYQSVLDNILQRHSTLKVGEAKDGASLENDFVYYAPPHYHLEIKDNLIHFVEREEGEGVNMAYDIFMKSLALSESRRKCIAIILSGKGKDGIAGVMEIKKAGGLVIVQSPESCEYAELPLQVIENEQADFVLLPEDMPVIIHGYVNRFNYKKNNENTY